MKFEDVFNLLENFDKIDGKYVKNDAKYYHYTNLKSFHKIVNDLIRDKIKDDKRKEEIKQKIENNEKIVRSGLKGRFYNVNTYNHNFNKANSSNRRNMKELCLVRSDMLPDRVPNKKLDVKEEIRITKLSKEKALKEINELKKKLFDNTLSVKEKNEITIKIEALNRIALLREFTELKKKLSDGTLSTEEKNRIATLEKTLLIDLKKNPDNTLSDNAGDIKFTFDEDKLVSRFGKIKPIEEFNIQDKKDLEVSLNNCVKDLNKKKIKDNGASDLVKDIITDIKENCHNIKLKDMERKLLYISDFMKHPELAGEVLKAYLNYRNIAYTKLNTLYDLVKPNLRTREHMESRVRIPADKVITHDLVKQILLPDYLKGNEKIDKKISKLKKKGFNNIDFYDCKYPREKLPEETSKVKKE